MPKEVTHFLIVEQVIKELAKKPFWKPFIQYHNTIKLGAIFHDSLYYYNKAVFIGEKRIADILHGSDGEDTFEIFKQLYKKNLISQNEPHLLAFIIGMASHIFTDATFHPMVYYFTGNYYDNDKIKKSIAAQNHRKLEGLIDLYYTKEAYFIDNYKIETMVDTGIDNKSLFTNVSKGLDGTIDSPVLSRIIYSSYQKFAGIQKYYNHKLARTLIPHIDLISPNLMKELFSLFYNEKSKKYFHKLSEEIHYLNPLTGQLYYTSMDSLFEQSVEKTIQFCKRLEDILQNKVSINELGVGPSLELGHPNCSVNDMKYFNNERFFN